MGIPEILNRAIREIGIAGKAGCIYDTGDILMTLLLGFLLKCETFDDIHDTLGGVDNHGVWLGKKKLPCMKIVKEHIQKTATPELVKKLKNLLAHALAKAKIVDLGVLYIDAHFVTYYGKENISKGYSTIRRLALKGIYHHFAGDRQGRPIMFYLTNGSVRLNRTLKMLLRDIQSLRKQYDPDRPLFLVFDRETYDAKLFKWLDDQNVVFLTYMKNAPDYTDEEFPTSGTTVRFRTKHKKYQYFVTQNSISGYHKEVKSIVIRDVKSGRKSVIITNCDRVKFRDKHIRPRNKTLIEYMVNRWGQENFFKRAVNEVNINHHFGYLIQDCSPQPKVDNPKLKDLQKELAKLKKNRERTQSQIASLILKKEKTRSIQELAASSSPLKKLLQERLRLVGEINACQLQIDALPEKVIYTDAYPQKQPRKECDLAKKDLLDTLKIMAFFVHLLMEEKFSYCHRNKRTLVPALEKLLCHPTDFIVSETECVVRFHPFCFPSMQNSVQNFCKNLNIAAVRHPVFDKPIRFEVQEGECGKE